MLSLFLLFYISLLLSMYIKRILWYINAHFYKTCLLVKFRQILQGTDFCSKWLVELNTILKEFVLLDGWQKEKQLIHFDVLYAIQKISDLHPIIQMMIWHPSSLFKRNKGHQHMRKVSFLTHHHSWIFSILLYRTHTIWKTIRMS